MRNPELIDKLGRVKAKIAELAVEEAELVKRVKQQLLVAGERDAEGKLFRATFSVFEREGVDTEVIRKVFPKVDYPDYYKSALVERLDVTARTGEMLEAA